MCPQKTSATINDRVWSVICLQWASKAINDRLLMRPTSGASAQQAFCAPVDHEAQFYWGVHFVVLENYYGNIRRGVMQISLCDTLSGATISLGPFIFAWEFSFLYGKLHAQYAWHDKLSSEIIYNPLCG